MWPFPAPSWTAGPLLHACTPPEGRISQSCGLEGDAPAAAKVEAFLARALEATGSNANITAGALVRWICDALLSNHSVKAYGRDLMDFVRHMQARGVAPPPGDGRPCECYKRAAWKPA